MLHRADEPASGYVIKSGAESSVLAYNTRLTYRTNHGDVRGEAPVLSLRAGGALDIKGSLSDGFFVFRDQSDKTYRQALGKTYNTDYILTLNGGFVGFGPTNNSPQTQLTDWSTWSSAPGTAAPTVYLGLSVAARSSQFNAQTQLAVNTANVPYSPMGNSPAALGSYKAADGLGNIDGGGDPLGSAVVFPLLPDNSFVLSSSYILTAGAANLAGGSVLGASADPFRIDPAAAANLTVAGRSFFQVPASGPMPSSDGKNIPGLLVDNLTPGQGGGLGFGGTARATTGGMLTLADWLAQATNPATFRGVSDTSVAVLYLGRDGQATGQQANDGPNRTLMLDLFGQFAAAHGLVQNSTDANTGWRYDPANPTATAATYIAMSVKTFKLFVNEKLIPALPQIEANLRGVTTPTNALPVPGATTTSTGAAAATTRTMVNALVRTGTGSIRLGAAGNLDLTNGPVTYVNRTDGQIANIVNADGSIGQRPQDCVSAGCTAQLGGVAVYTAGHIAVPLDMVLPDPVTGDPIAVKSPAAKTSIFATPYTFTYAPGGFALGTVVADTIALTGGGDISVSVQGSVLSRRDLVVNNSGGVNTTYGSWFGSVDYIPSAPQGQEGTPGAVERGARPDQPWRVVDEGPDIGGKPTATISSQLFREGIGALGGGNVTINAGGNVSDVTVVSETSLASTTTMPPGASTATNLLLTFGGGNVAIRAGGDILAARVDVPSGTALLAAGGDIGAAAPITVSSYGNYSFVDLTGHRYFYFDLPLQPITTLNETRVRIDDAIVDLVAGGDITLKGIAPLDGFYSPRAALNLKANGSVTVNNNIQMRPISGNAPIAVYPGTFTATAMTGEVNVKTIAAPVTFAPTDPLTNQRLPVPDAYNINAPGYVVMAPSPYGQLSIMAGGDIQSSTIAMLDLDPNYVPGLFTLGGSILYTTQNPDGRVNRPYQWDSVGFPLYKSTMSITQLKRQHASTPLHTGDDEPVYIYAGGDIGNKDSGLSLSLPKQARIYAGQDIVNMMFMGQNLDSSDITRVVAGRDIIGIASLATASYADRSTNPTTFYTRGLEPTLLGNTFILGGPGDLSIEAGRNLGPFLNSADIRDTTSFSANPPTLRYGGGIITVGNEWNPYLPAESANITVTFGSAKGADYAALRDAYIKPGSDAFALGGYGPKLIDWMKKNADKELKAAYNTTDVSADDAYTVFLTLSGLRQRSFLINDVYFNELRAPADPSGPSYLKYSRGYTAVNTLFPASLGYTANGLDGGDKATMVHTGDLDLRLAAIETLYGGNINILGPGGRVLAGSVVATSAQIERRNYAGLSLFRPIPRVDGLNGSVDYVLGIPPGYEGVLTQRGGTINTFTDGDFLLNQSRLFTVDGDDITMWSSNADLNGGQGAKTTPNFPPVLVRLNEDMIPTTDRTGATTGAGIAAFPSKDKSKRLPTVYLEAPRGTVDAGDAGVRSAGDINVAALTIANADNFRASGNVSGLPTLTAPNIGGLTEASNAAGQAAKQLGEPKQNTQAQPSIIIVEVLGFGGGSGPDNSGPPSVVGAPANNGNGTAAGNGTLTGDGGSKQKKRE